MSICLSYLSPSWSLINGSLRISPKYINWHRKFPPEISAWRLMVGGVRGVRWGHRPTMGSNSLRCTRHLAEKNGGTSSKGTAGSVAPECQRVHLWSASETATICYPENFPNLNDIRNPERQWLRTCTRTHSQLDWNTLLATKQSIKVYFTGTCMGE